MDITTQGHAPDAGARTTADAGIRPTARPASSRTPYSTRTS